MAHIPGHHGRGMEAAGPIVEPSDVRTHPDHIATRTESAEMREAMEQHIKRVQRSTQRLSDQRAVEIEEGLEHLTPAMAVKLGKSGV